MEKRGRPLLGCWRSRLGVLMLALGAVACESERERFDRHLDNAATLAKEAPPGPHAAVLELENALRIEPNRPSVHYQLAEVLRASRRLSEAIFYYEEALHLDPENTESAVQLARLLRERDPERARDLIAAAIESAPTRGLPIAVRAELHLGRGDWEASLSDARQSVALEPQESLGYWILAQALYAQALEQTRQGRPADSETIQEGLEALDRYTEFSGDQDPWSALPPRARFLALDPKRVSEAQAAWNELIQKTAPEKAPLYIAQRGTQSALELAREWRIDPFRLVALKRLIELSPRNIAYWDELAAVRESLDGSGKQILEDMLEAKPDDPEAHLRYVSYLRATEGRPAAIAHLRQHIYDEELAPDMLGALSELYKQAGELEEAEQARTTLMEDFPWHHVTLFVHGREALARGDSERAAVMLRLIVEDRRNAQAASLLAHAEMARRDYPKALDAIARAIEIDPSQRESLLPLRARAYVQMNQCQHAVMPYGHLHRKKKLASHDKIAFARCLYTLGNAPNGLRLLLEVIQDGDPQNEALFELVDHEQDNPALQDAIRERLRAAHAADPNNAQLATSLSVLDFKTGRTDQALARLANQTQKGPLDPEARLLRARILFETGDRTTARAEFEELFHKQPQLKGILPGLLTALLADGDRTAALAVLQRGERFSLLGPDRYVLYATLLLEQGDRKGARRALEQAYLRGVQDPEVMIELALLQLREDRDFEKALHFARLAVNWSARSPESLNTVAVVLLEMDRSELAIRYLEEAFAAGADAEPALRAGTHYRMALALLRSGREQEAAPHFERAHALNPQIPAGPPPQGEDAANQP